MKFKNKNTELDVDAEKIIEKGMVLHEKSWKDKFTMKHNAKKEMMELKHQLKLDNKFKRVEEKRKLKELELEEKRMQEEAERKRIKSKILASCILGIIGTIFIVIGLAKGSHTENGEAFGIVGFCFYLPIAFIWLDSLAKKK